MSQHIRIWCTKCQTDLGGDQCGGEEIIMPYGVEVDQVNVVRYEVDLSGYYCECDMDEDDAGQHWRIDLPNGRDLLQMVEPTHPEQFENIWRLTYIRHLAKTGMSEQSVVKCVEEAEEVLTHVKGIDHETLVRMLNKWDRDDFGAIQGVLDTIKALYS